MENILKRTYPQETYPLVVKSRLNPFENSTIHVK